ncbi:MAG: hypothetical protein ACODAD_16485, partial [Planctomycetota bacterium]
LTLPETAKETVLHVIVATTRQARQLNPLTLTQLPHSRQSLRLCQRALSSFQSSQAEQRG